MGLNRVLQKRFSNGSIPVREQVCKGGNTTVTSTLRETCAQPEVEPLLRASTCALSHNWPCHASRNRPLNETYGSAFLDLRRTTSASVGLPLDESQNSSHNQNLKRSGS